ncbi:MAG: hypothetical protein GH142_07025 [Dehalococcoidia bacterium]|nr:hypothetical protein [Dehalococcoidia bacterium]
MLSTGADYIRPAILSPSGRRINPYGNHGSANPDKKCCPGGLIFVCLDTMDPHDMSIQMALYYIMGILAAAVVFRIIRSRRRSRDKNKKSLL